MGILLIVGIPLIFSVILPLFIPHDVLENPLAHFFIDWVIGSAAGALVLRAFGWKLTPERLTQKERMF